MDNDKLNKDDKFRFDCNPGVSCFNDCCGDVNIVLTPYDIVRLKKNLGISSEEFLAKYTISPFTKEQKVPVILLKMDESERKKCQFVGEKGCTVYNDRPWACRMYPLGLASPKGGDTAEEKEFYFLLEDAKCKGHLEDKEQPIRDYLKAQGVAEYDRMGNPFKEVSLHDYLLKGGEMNPQKMEMFHTVCYNIDKFRRLVYSNKDFFEMFEIEDKERELMEYDDEALLLFGFRWLRFSLFNEPVVKMTDKAKKRVEGKMEKLAKKSAKSE